jgi:type IV secretion system protein VirB2
MVGREMKVNASDCHVLMFGASMVAVAVLLTFPSDAMAQDAVSKALDKGVDLLTDRWARAAAIIALAVLGYGMWSGWWSKRLALGWVGGVALVFGGATIVDFFTS